MTGFLKIFGAALVAGAALLVAPDARADAHDCETITLGAVVSLTGKYASDGTHIKNGYEYAIRRIEEAGGIVIDGQCHTFEVMYYDDESQKDRSAILAERLIKQDEVRYMLGPSSSGMTMAVASVTEQYGVPMVAAGGASPLLFDQGHRYLFGVLSTADQYFVPAVRLAAEQTEKSGKKSEDVTVAIAVGNDMSSLEVRAGILDAVAQYGMTVVVDANLSRPISDMMAILKRVEGVRPDLLLVSGHSKGAAAAVRLIGEGRIDVSLIALTHCEDIDVTDVEGILCATQWSEALPYEDAIFGTAGDYGAGFRQVFPEYTDLALPHQTAQASAAVHVLKDAFERAGILGKEAVRNALAATDLATFYGPVRFAPAGNNIAKPMVLRQVQDGEYAVVAPPEVAANVLSGSGGAQ